MSRIMPAMSDGRSFTNYVSSGLYNNYLEAQFKTPLDSEYRAYLQNNSREVEKKINKLTVTYVNPPVMKTSKLNVAGDPTDARVSAAPAGQSQKILDESYRKNLRKFNANAARQLQYLESLDEDNYASF